MLEDSAPRGEELPGDGDWNTDSTGKHSEHRIVRAWGNRPALREREAHAAEEHFSSEKTSLERNCQMYVEGLDLSSFR